MRRPVVAHDVAVIGKLHGATAEPVMERNHAHP
jgi:hypothetical protein